MTNTMTCKFQDFLPHFLGSL